MKWITPWEDLSEEAKAEFEAKCEREDKFLQDAADIIARMKLARPTCEECFKLETTYAAGACMFNLGRRSITNHEHDAFMHEHGWEQLAHQDAWVKRCAGCANTLMFPWADLLDAHKVADMLEHDARCQQAFELSILKETLHPDGIPMVRKVDYRMKLAQVGVESGQRRSIGSVIEENGPQSQEARELLESCLRKGWSREKVLQFDFSPVHSHPSFAAPTVEVTKVDPEAKTVEMRAIPTTAEGGGVKSDGFFQERRVLSRATGSFKSDGFFLHLEENLGTEIRVPIHIHFEQPYRTFTITGIKPTCTKCGELDCTKNHAEFT